MRFLVTGSSGKLGTPLVHLIRRHGHECLGLDLTRSETTDCVGDLCDRGLLASLTKGRDVVIHTAALHGRHLDLGVSKSDFVRTNIQGTLGLLEASLEAGASKFLFTSSTSIYGHALVCDERAVWVDEELTPRPRDIYDITKQAGEELCREFFDAEGFQTCVLRVSRFMTEPLNDIANYRLYRGLDERDGAAAHLLAALSHLENFEIFNISNHSPFQKEDLSALKSSPGDVIVRRCPEARQLYAALGWSFPDSIDRVYVVDKAIDLLGYKPRYNFLSFVQACLEAGGNGEPGASTS